MREYIAQQKTVIITIILALGVLIFLVVRPSSEPASVQSAQTAKPTAPFKTIDTNSAMKKGNASAPVSIIQYSDLICPSCSYFSTQVMPAIEKNYINTGKVKFEFRPMAFIADGSTQAGMGAYCAIDQNKFWQYHDAIYADVVDKVFRQKLDPKTDVILTANSVKQIASSAGVDTTQFDACIDTRKHLADITDSTERANQNGVASTPYIMVNGTAYTGDISLTAFETFIKAML